jgi:RNA polymerase sigma-70 factor (ECF subfamily)
LSVEKGALPLDSRPDETLVAASREGDEDAYASLVRRHLRYVFAICLGILGARADAEDAVQDVFLKGFTGIGSLRAEDRFVAWIGQIARNHCKDHVRRRTRRAEEPLTDLHETDLPRHRTAAAEDEFHDLHAALERLSDDLRMPLLLYYYDGKSTRRLAEELGLTQGGACARLYRARRELRRLLEEEAIQHG